MEQSLNPSPLNRLRHALRRGVAVRQDRLATLRTRFQHAMQDAKRFAPQGGNRQGVRFVIVRDPEKKRRLGEWYLPPWREAYHAAKAGVVGLTRATAIDSAAAGITVNAVAPGWIDTASASDHERAMGAATPVGRSGTADEVAHAIAFLAGEGASYITGQLITVDGANSISEERGRSRT